jgi:hypothetical protein
MVLQKQSHAFPLSLVHQNYWDKPLSEVKTFGIFLFGPDCKQNCAARKDDLIGRSVSESRLLVFNTWKGNLLVEGVVHLHFVFSLH